MPNRQAVQHTGRLRHEKIAFITGPLNFEICLAERMRSSDR